jgi:hypothetical protein
LERRVDVVGAYGFIGASDIVATTVVATSSAARR